MQVQCLSPVEWKYKVAEHGSTHIRKHPGAIHVSKHFYYFSAADATTHLLKVHINDNFGDI